MAKEVAKIPRSFGQSRPPAWIRPERLTVRYIPRNESDDGRIISMGKILIIQLTIAGFSLFIAVIKNPYLVWDLPRFSLPLNQ
jgi:hypothetical protein